MRSEVIISTHERPVHTPSRDTPWGDTPSGDTPWGIADSAREYAAGIVFYSTPSHGGFALSPERLAQMHPALREPDGWFEEDCAFAKVVYSFPDAFSAGERADAVRTLKDWFPDEYETVTGERLAPGESRNRDRQLFHERHAGDLIVISAVLSDRFPGQVECIATIGGHRGTARDGCGVKEHRCLVAKAEYAARGPHGFVIDPARHTWPGT